MITSCNNIIGGPGPLANATNGVKVFNANSNEIAREGAGNLISGNGNDGVQFLRAAAHAKTR